jgi:3-methyladenine DNA glycosylase AlkC
MSLTTEQILAKVQGKTVRSVRHLAFDTSRQLSPAEAFTLARKLFATQNIYGCMAGALMAGHISYILSDALQFLRVEVARHKDVRVQDSLARSLDHYCLNRGYERALPVMREWGRDENELVRRAMIEAPRPWTRKEYFKANPAKAVETVARLKSDPSGIVRFSVGRAMSEISLDFPKVVIAEIKSWNTRDASIKHTYMYAAKHLQGRIGSFGNPSDKEE